MEDCHSDPFPLSDKNCRHKKYAFHNVIGIFLCVCINMNLGEWDFCFVFPCYVQCNPMPKTCQGQQFFWQAK